MYLKDSKRSIERKSSIVNFFAFLILCIHCLIFLKKTNKNKYLDRIMRNQYILAKVYLNL